jgi:dissimilatory sulfite reductase (desulfoviridin) alpha/beta subunit
MKYSMTYPCEFCKSMTLPTLTIAEAEKKNASVGAFIIRRHKITEETRRSVVCHHCMKNVDDDRIYNKDERPFMEFVGPEDLYD